MKDSKFFEVVAVVLTIIAYSLIVEGALGYGFVVGMLASLCYTMYFLMIKSFPSLGLQLFFICANMYGLLKLGVL